jgi:DNA-binding MarR family transcriptional regulator
MHQSSPPSQLGDHLGFWLRFVSNQVSEQFRKQVEAQGVTVSEWVALRQLYEGEGSSVAELVDRLGMTKGAISKVLDRLEAKGMLRRVETTEDRRLLRLELLPAGRALVPVLAALADANDAHYFSSLSEEDRQHLLRILQSIVHHHHLRRLPLH